MPENNRRKFLKGIGATGLGLASIPSMSAARQQSPAQVVSKHGKKGKPLTRGDIESVYRRAVAQYKAQGGEGPVAKPGFEFPENAEIQSFVFLIDAEGSVDYYLGLTSDTEHPGDVHERAEQYEARFGQFTSEENTISASQSVDEEWNRVAGGTMDYKDKPIGWVVSDADVWEYAEPADQARFISRTDLTTYPGYQQWGTEWYNDDMWVSHEWEDYAPGDALLVDHRPNEDYTGSQDLSLSLGYQTAAINWDYDSPDIHQYDNSQNPNGQWHWEYRRYGVTVGGKNSDVMSVGSEMTSSSYPSSGDLLLFSSSDVQYYGNNTNEHKTRGVLHSFEY